MAYELDMVENGVDDLEELACLILKKTAEAQPADLQIASSYPQTSPAQQVV